MCVCVYVCLCVCACFSLLFSDFSPKADVAYKNIKIQQDTTTTELIQLAMHKFGIEVILASSFLEACVHAINICFM